MRIWLPGRLSCSTACRSANDRDRASGLIARSNSVPARCRTIAVAAKPAATSEPMRSEPACHTVRPTRPATTSTVTTICVTSGRRTRASSRSNNDGFTCRTSSSGTSENSSDTSRPMPSPCDDGRPGQRVGDLDAGRRAGQQRRDRPHRQPGEHHAEQAAGQAEHRHLRDIDGEQLRRSRAEALQHRDALHLLLHEHAGDARHADAAEDHDHEADQAQVILGAGEFLADVVFGGLVGAHARELVGEVGAQIDNQLVEAWRRAP